MPQSNKLREIGRLTDLAEAVIGELPLKVVAISEINDFFVFTLEHITDGECWFTLSGQAVHLGDGAVRMLMDREIERILDILWERVDAEQ